ncbi:hypothetical protein GCM10010412_070610 [Nonomuraea recticatena]|uniref:Uncharacterized protein n=1 Tax=Nonomuraea recticatena TaxID=46178 RepID=A0ABP6FB72_9ACTN
MSSTQKYACRSVFTEVGGADCGGGAVMAVQFPPGRVAAFVADVGVGAGVGAAADREQAVSRTAAQRALIMTAAWP